jgi:hypothetical protein
VRDCYEGGGGKESARFPGQDTSYIPRGAALLKAVFDGGGPGHPLSCLAYLKPTLLSVVGAPVVVKEENFRTNRHARRPSYCLPDRREKLGRMLSRAPLSRPSLPTQSLNVEECHNLTKESIDLLDCDLVSKSPVTIKRKQEKKNDRTGGATYTPLFIYLLK